VRPDLGPLAFAVARSRCPGGPVAAEDGHSGKRIRRRTGTPESGHATETRHAGEQALRRAGRHAVIRRPVMTVGSMRTHRSRGPPAQGELYAHSPSRLVASGSVTVRARPRTRTLQP
jgi:hypothetical protein